MFAALTPPPPPLGGEGFGEGSEPQHADLTLKGYTCKDTGSKLFYQLTANLQNVKHF